MSDRYDLLKEDCCECMLGFFFPYGAGTPFFGDDPRIHTLRTFRSTLIVEHIRCKKLSKIVNREWRPVGSNPHRLFVRCRCILVGSTHYPFAVQPTVGVLDSLFDKESNVGSVAYSQTNIFLLSIRCIGMWKDYSGLRYRSIILRCTVDLCMVSSFAYVCATAVQL